MSATTTATTTSPVASGPPEWNSDPAWKLPGWAEPVIVASILFGACYYTRRRGVNLFSKQTPYKPLLDQELQTSQSSDEMRYEEDDSIDTEFDYGASTLKHPPNRRRYCGLTITTPNSSRYAHHWHSRALHKFPFLMEMFYWIITYFIYRMTHILAQALFSNEIWDIAEGNALKVLFIEQFSGISFFFPIQEIQVQKWFLSRSPALLTILNKAYALLHIPGTVYFIAWYYYAAPTHAAFAVMRRTITLCNLMAFAIFTAYPCMPPRLLPAEFGFIDTVRRDDAESVWMSGKFVNHLAAMPSMHFGYAFMIGVTCVYHAGGFRWMRIGYENKSGKGWRYSLILFGISYPIFVCTVIVATANHYWLDVVAAIFTAAAALICNRIFMVFVPAEDLLLWAIRAKKPAPTTGTLKK